MRKNSTVALTGLAALVLAGASYGAAAASSHPDSTTHTPATSVLATTHGPPSARTPASCTHVRQTTHHAVCYGVDAGRHAWSVRSAWPTVGYHHRDDGDHGYGGHSGYHHGEYQGGHHRDHQGDHQGDQGRHHRHVGRHDDGRGCDR